MAITAPIEHEAASAPAPSRATAISSMPDEPTITVEVASKRDPIIPFLILGSITWVAIVVLAAALAL